MCHILRGWEFHLPFSQALSGLVVLLQKAPSAFSSLAVGWPTLLAHTGTGPPGCPLAPT
eukprot:jgi/Botrbrau1/3642/Bobra.0204s0033.1